MKSKQQLVKDSLELAKNNIALPEILYFALDKAKTLADIYQADYDIVSISICLMDIKLQEAKKQGNIKKHVEMASEFAKIFLRDYDITEEEFSKIINGIEAHHGEVSFTSIEAEICANADCYIFIHPTGVFSYMGLLVKRNMSLKEQIEQVKFKLEEKHRILSLDKVKEELEEFYQMFLKMFDTIIK